MTDNILRRVTELWKERHDHDGEDFQEQLTLIKTTVEEQSDVVAASGSGAYIHLAVSDQSIAVDGEDVEWSQVDTLGLFEFQTPDFPVTTVTIPKSGYYNLAVPILEWESWTLGGEVSIWRNDVKVWPPLNDSRWSTTERSVWHPDSSHAIWFDAGDTFRLFVDHGSSSTQTLAHAAVSAYLVDRAGTPDWELVFPFNGYGVTWDGSNWWTTDDTPGVDPALFKLAEDGSVVASYSGFDTSTALRNRSIVYAASFLWAVGGEDSTLFKLDPSDGSTVTTFATGGVGLSDVGVGYDGTNLFHAEVNEREIREINTSGVLQAVHSYPAGRSVRDLTWTGSEWWATDLDSTSVFSMNSSFVEQQSMPGPAVKNDGCHYRDGYLYVMTGSGLYRRTV